MRYTGCPSMIVIETAEEMQQMAQQFKARGKQIGFVPTMGYLHEGHLALVTEAKKNDEVIVMSIFVNPLQFGPTEDYEQYPRDLTKDRSLAEEHGVDVLFCPPVSEIYPQEMTSKIHITKRVDVLCGKTREGHYDGVATVLFKLFHLVLPDRAYFGKKDAQQVAVIDGFIKDYNFPITLIPCSTVREKDGLAKSSRNVNLTPEERMEAPLLYKHLLAAKTMMEDGEQQIQDIRDLVYKQLSSTITGKIDYFEVLSYPELEKLTNVSGNIIIALAVQYSKVRLIDNITFTLNVGEENACFAQ